MTEERMASDHTAGDGTAGDGTAGESAGLSIGEVAERTGLSVHALRFYEKEGVFLAPPRRAPGGRRVYTEDDIDWLTLCTILRTAGMPIDDIRRYTELVRAGDGNETERLELLRRHEERVREQQEQLARCLDLITFKIGVYEDILAAGEPSGRREAGLLVTDAAECAASRRARPTT